MAKNLIKFDTHSWFFKTPLRKLVIEGNFNLKKVYKTNQSTKITTINSELEFLFWDKKVAVELSVRSVVIGSFNWDWSIHSQIHLDGCWQVWVPCCLVLSLLRTWQVAPFKACDPRKKRGPKMKAALFCKSPSGCHNLYCILLVTQPNHVGKEYARVQEKGRHAESFWRLVTTNIVLESYPVQ